MRLTNYQRIVLWVGIGLVLLVGLFPPWVHLNGMDGGEGRIAAFEHFKGYGALFSSDDDWVRVDGRMWFVNVATIVLVTCGVMLALPTHRPKGPRHE